MKKALISVQENISNFDSTQGYRIAEVSNTGFEVAEPLFWVDCADEAIADQFYYDPVDESIKSVPIPEPIKVITIGNTPNVIA